MEEERGGGGVFFYFDFNLKVVRFLFLRGGAVLEEKYHQRIQKKESNLKAIFNFNFPPRLRRHLPTSTHQCLRLQRGSELCVCFVWFWEVDSTHLP